MEAIAYCVCPYCHGAVDATRAARQGALDIIDAVLFALDDSSIHDLRKALAAISSALRAADGRELPVHLWPVEELARQAAMASQRSEAP